MSATDLTQGADEAGAAVAAARAGDESAFSALVERHRRELQVHCYRMLGSFEDAEDLVQETFLRAWSRRETFEGRSTFRAWLYRIATNACLDALDRRKRRPAAADEGDRGPGEGAGRGGNGGAEREVTWLQPYPDHLLEGIAAPEDEPDAAVVSKETIELTFLVAIQHLPPRQRAVLLMRGVLGWSAKETGELLEMSVPSVNSALQRARGTLRRHLPPARTEWAAGVDPTDQERELVRRYVEASEDPDPDTFAELMRHDVRWTMPPQPGVWIGPEATIEAWKAGGFGSPDFGELRCLVTRANMQPAVANYVRRPGDSEYRPMALDVLRISDGLIADIVTFPGDVFKAFDLPRKLSD